MKKPDIIDTLERGTKDVPIIPTSVAFLLEVILAYLLEEPLWFKYLITLGAGLTGGFLVCKIIVVTYHLIYSEK